MISSNLFLVRKSPDSKALASNCCTKVTTKFRACSSCWALPGSNSSWNEASSQAENNNKCFIKFSFSEKAKKIAQSFSWFWHLLSQNHQEDGTNFCGLLRRAELWRDKTENTFSLKQPVPSLKKLVVLFHLLAFLLSLLNVLVWIFGKSLLQPFTVWMNCSYDLKNFANSRPSALNFKRFSRSLEQFLLTVGQNNIGNKIPLIK